MEEPIRSEKELLDMHTHTRTHTHTHTFSRKRCKGNKTVVEKGRGAGREKRMKREAD